MTLFFNKISEKFLFYKIRSFLENDFITLYNLSICCNLNFKFMKFFMNKIYLNNNIKKINIELKSYILEKNDIGSTILYRIQGMPLLEDSSFNYIQEFLIN